MAYRCCSHTSTGESHFFLTYSRDPVLPVHKFITSVQPYETEITIAKSIVQKRDTLTTDAKMLTKKKGDQNKCSRNTLSHHTFQVGILSC